ncbi:zinc metalloprotease [archaeon]|nr:MAG: zinc metalloprotease [archaeon]
MEQNSKEELAAKIALKQGGNSMLNVYTVQLTSDVLAWSTFPVVTLFEPERDGIVLSYRTLPGGDLEPYNLGDTLVHEGGHWLGLLHTFFQDGICKPGSAVTGDFISDTPAERIPAYGCPIGRDTCVGSDFAGLDPVTNFMDYSDDQCMTHFTSQQASRMRANWRAFRDGGDT